MSEKRNFSRVIFSGQCSLIEDITGTAKIWHTELIDISLKGALVKRPVEWNSKDNAIVQLTLNLEGSDVVLECTGEVCHQENKNLGIKFLTLSLESISHLKRLVQLNLADENLLHREMSQLINLANK